MVPLVNQFVIMYGFGTIESMIGPYMKENGATNFAIAFTFLGIGTAMIIGNVFVALVSLTKTNFFVISLIKPLNKGESFLFH